MVTGSSSVHRFCTIGLHLYLCFLIVNSHSLLLYSIDTHARARAAAGAGLAERARPSRSHAIAATPGSDITRAREGWLREGTAPPCVSRVWLEALFNGCGRPPTLPDPAVWCDRAGDAHTVVWWDATRLSSRT